MKLRQYLYNKSEDYKEDDGSNPNTHRECSKHYPADKDFSDNKLDYHFKGNNPNSKEDEYEDLFVFVFDEWLHCE